MNNSPLILPGHPLFNLILHSQLPPGWQNNIQSQPIFVASADGSGMLRQVNEAEYYEYINGGEFDLIEGEEIIEYDI